MSLFRSAFQKVINLFHIRQGGIASHVYSTSISHRENSAVNITQEVISTCNKLAEQKTSRNFAIVYLLGKQWRVSDGDLLVIEGYWPPNIGDKLKLEKVLLAGTKDFSLVGRPLVQPGLVSVHATVISKGLSHTRTHFKKKPTKQFMRINFQRCQQTMLRINSVDIKSCINSPKLDIE